MGGLPLKCSGEGGQSGSGEFDEAFEFADAGGVAHFAEGFRFDLEEAAESCWTVVSTELIDLVNQLGMLWPCAL
jgi:hypothetical protein